MGAHRVRVPPGTGPGATSSGGGRSRPSRRQQNSRWRVWKLLPWGYRGRGWPAGSAMGEDPVARPGGDRAPRLRTAGHRALSGGGVLEFFADFAGGEERDEGLDVGAFEQLMRGLVE